MAGASASARRRAPTTACSTSALPVRPWARCARVLLFLLAKNAWHARFKQLEFYQTRALRLSFDGPLPVQMDGEPFQAQEYDIACVPHALNVLVP